MKIEQKQGIIISALVVLLMAVLALIADWPTSLGEATVGFRGIPLDDCGESDKPFHYERNSSGEYDIACPYKHYLFAFTVRLLTLWAVLSPIFVYGFLRSLLIVKPLFTFESRLTKVIPSSDTPRDGA